MTPVEYRPAQSRFVLCFCGVFTVWGLVSVGVFIFGSPGALSWLGLALITFIPYLANNALGVTRVDETGIRVRRPVGRHSAHWHDIADIGVHRVGGGSEVRYDKWIRVTRHDGTSFRLPAPMTSSAYQDDTFEAKLEDITLRRRRATGRP
ncbi:PH domain-containing protein [Streptomyces sp. PSRA5]|uniref:PH domain-containing protein n=1 Tax=Streptomyces panacea TaxID=3035064 RepID=UPI00339C1B6E